MSDRSPIDVERRSIRSYERRLRLAGVIDVTTWISAGLLLACGLFVLWVRLFAIDLAPHVAPAFQAAGAVSLLTFMVLFFRSTWRRGDVAAFADWHAGAGGLLLTLDEHPDPAWQGLLAEKMRAKTPPGVKLDGPFNRMFAAGLFAGLVLLVPQRQPEWQDRLIRLGNNSVDRLEDRVKKFEAEKLLQEADRAEIAKEIERLRKTVQDGRFGAEQWEAIDALQRRLDDKVQEAVSALEGALDAATMTPSSGADRADRQAAMQSAMMKALQTLKQTGLLENLPESVDASMIESLMQMAGEAGKLLSQEDLAKLQRAVFDLLPGK